MISLHYDILKIMMKRIMDSMCHEFWLNSMKSYACDGCDEIMVLLSGRHTQVKFACARSYRQGRSAPDKKRPSPYYYQLYY